jgi:hypothetical protein
MSDEVINIGGITPAWLANELDDQGVVRLRDVFSDEWLEAMRASVEYCIARNGDGDFFIHEADHEVGSPPHRLVSDPAFRQLFIAAANLRWPQAGSANNDIRCSMLVRAGNGPKARSNRFHYDAAVLTMVVPIFIPDADLGTNGELAAFGNKRRFRRYFASHLVDTILTHNSLYRRYVARTIHAAPEDHLVELRPGDAYLFWGYRTFHGNLPCAPGLLRTTLVLHYGAVHSDSWAMRMAWKMSRSRRDLGRLQYLSAIPATPEVPA